MNVQVWITSFSQFVIQAYFWFVRLCGLSNKSLLMLEVYRLKMVTLSIITIVY